MSKNSASVSLLNKLICTFFGIGRIPFASGTFATVAAYGIIIGVVFLLAQTLDFWLFWSVFIGSQILFYFLSVHQVDTYLTKTGKKDPSEIVIDEVLGTCATFTVNLLILTILAKIPLLAQEKYGALVFTYHFHIVSLVVFRLFDIFKPGIIGKFDKQNTGTGVIMDDVLAGIFAGITTNILYIVYVLVF